MDTGEASADLSDPGLMVVELSQRGLFRRKLVGGALVGCDSMPSGRNLPPPRLARQGEPHGKL